VNAIDLLVGSFLETPVKALSTYGMIWTAGGLFLSFLIALIGNYAGQLAIPLLRLLAGSLVSLVNLSVPYYTGNSLWMLVQIPVLAFPLIYLFKDKANWALILFLSEFVVSAGLHLGFALGFIADNNLMVAVGFAMIGLLPVCLFLMWLVSMFCCCWNSEEDRCANCSETEAFDPAALEEPHGLFWASCLTIIAHGCHLLLSGSIASPHGGVRRTAISVRYETARPHFISRITVPILS
jgi:hypothetical protein